MINSPSFLGYTRLGAETTASKTDQREVLPPQTVLLPNTDVSSNMTLGLQA